MDNAELSIVYNVNFGHVTSWCALQCDAGSKVDMAQKRIFVNKKERLYEVEKTICDAYS